MSWQQTCSGLRMDLLDPIGKCVPLTIDDLATGLSNICRFGGHMPEFYSVAQHSILVRNLCKDQRPVARLACLLHDAHEPFWGFGDIVSPAKRMDGDIEKFLEDQAYRIDEWVCLRFGLDMDELYTEAVADADILACALERKTYMNKPKSHIPEWDTLPNVSHYELIDPPLPPHLIKPRYVKALEDAITHYHARSLAQS